MKPLFAFYRFLVMMFTKSRNLDFSQRTRSGLFMAFLLLGKMAVGQNELPPAVANLQTIKAGSFIIPMDTVYQRSPGYFNLKAYGLINTLLQNEIPVKWAIRAGKLRTTAANTTDFTSIVTRVFPDSLSDTTIAFRNGPFIIDSVWTSKAAPIILAYGNNVFVYKLKNNTSIDIRYRLTFKPHLVLLNGGGFDTIAVRVLNEAGYSAGTYFKQLAGQVYTPASGTSLVSDTHYTPGDASHVAPVMQFVNQYGGNLFAECAAIGAYENGAFIMTTGGIDSSSTGIPATIYSYPDMPIAQFLGPLHASYGEYRWWRPKAASTFKPATVAYKIINSNSSGNITVAGAKLRSNSEKGSNVYYLPGHDFYSYNNGSANDNAKINGRRIFLNATLIPPNDSTNLDFITDVRLTMAVQPGLAVKNEPFNIYLILKNVGHWRAKNITIQAPFPLGLIYQSHTCGGGGSFNSGTGIWTLDSLTKNQTDTLKLTVLINQLGNFTYSASAGSQSLEDTLANNTASISLFGVSRPVAINDTMNFFNPLYQDISTKANDSDEDTGPFGNSTIIAGPYHGTAQVINGDTIRYTLNAGYAGLDSLQYLTCDLYPLCDTAWLIINIPFPLPITLLRFDGKRSNGEVNLHWITLSEKDNDYFSIERCTDNTSFVSRGSVKGAGNSSVLREYNFRDVDNNDAIYYYRLRQFDFNGQSQFSPVIALSQKLDNQVSFKLVPNPVGKAEQLLAVIKGLQQGESELRIADMTGRVIIKKTIAIAEANQLEFVNITDAIETGCYMVTLITPFETMSLRLIVK